MAQPPGLHVGLKRPTTNIWTQPKRVTTKSVINTKGSPTTVQIIFESLLFLGKKISESIQSSVSKARFGHMQEDAKESTEQKFKTIIVSVQKEKEKLESEMENDTLDLDCNSLLTFLNGKYNTKALIQAFFESMTMKIKKCLANSMILIMPKQYSICYITMLLSIKMICLEFLKKANAKVNV